MGQYYRVIVKNNNRNTVYNRNILRGGREEYMFAKLTEHSWWLNEFVNAVCMKIYKSKNVSKIAWIGDYADDIETINGLSNKKITKLHRLAWDCKGNPIESTNFTLEGLFLVNQSKQEYIDCDKYFNKSNMHGKYGDWCMHPLPILTCIGNGLGGGDYCSPTDDSTTEYIGHWAWDNICITKEAPTDYTEIYPIFKEMGWE